MICLLENALFPTIALQIMVYDRRLVIDNPQFFAAKA